MLIFDWIVGRQVEKRGRMIFFYLVLLAVLTQGAGLAQQDAPTRFEATGLDKPAQDVTLAGTVGQLNSTRTSGAPLLTVNSPQGAFTAILARNLNSQEQQFLSTGSPVQVTGVMETIGADSYLLARTITVNSALITFRNEHGFAVYPQGHKTNLSGGAK